MSDETVWQDELREWLLGRLGIGAEVGPVVATVDDLRAPPIRRWWMLEGKTYAFLNGSLASSWSHLVRSVRQLLATTNPEWRELERPEGEVDWLQTMAAAVTRSSPAFVCRSSKPGLLGEERATLLGWLGWLALEWQAHAKDFGLDATAVAPLAALAAVLVEVAPHSRLQRWAHVARRSRWPLLRLVVAESLRVYLEPQELERLPLPADRATLFELICLKRVAVALSEKSSAMRMVRWLTQTEDNELSVGALRCRFQRGLPASCVQAAYEPGLAAAIRCFEVGVPSRPDVWIRFATPLNGFRGILIEAKSGSQTSSAAIEQLRVYRAAIRSVEPGRVLAWGVLEQGQFSNSHAHFVAAQTATDEDTVWAFSGYGQVQEVLRAAGLLPSLAAEK